MSTGLRIRPAVAELAWPELSDGVVPIVVKVPVAVDPDAVLGLRVAFVDPAGRIGEIASRPSSQSSKHKMAAQPQPLPRRLMAEKKRRTQACRLKRLAARVKPSSHCR